MKQLSELRPLHDNGVLTEDEYEEQREELVQLMRQLKMQCSYRMKTDV